MDLPKLIIETYRGDPIRGLSLNDLGCISGTVLGRVCFYSFDSEEIQRLKKQVFFINNLFKKNFIENEGSIHNSQKNEIKKTNKNNINSSKLKISNFDKINVQKNSLSENHNLYNLSEAALEYTQSICTKNQYDKKCQILASYNNDAIKFVHLSSSHAYAIFENCQYNSWNLRDLKKSISILQDWRFKSEIKELMHFNGKMLIITNQRSVIIDIENNIQNDCSFVLFDRDLCLMDFNSNFVLCLVKSPQKKISVYVIEISISSAGILNKCASKKLDEAYKIELPLKIYISAACFWNPDCIVLAYKAKELKIFNFKEKKMINTLKGHSADIIALDGSDPGSLISLSRDQKLKIWSAKTHKCINTYDVKPAKFTLGWDYRISRKNDMVAFSSDQGIYLIKIEI